MKRVAAFVLVCLALGLVGACAQKVTVTEVDPKTGAKQITETTPAHAKAMLQAAGLNQLVGLVRAGKLGTRTVEIKPLDPTKPMNAIATVTDTDPAVARTLVKLAGFHQFREPESIWTRFIDRLFGLGEKTVDAAWKAYGVGELTGMVKAGFSAAGNRTTIADSFKTTGDQSPLGYTGGAQSPLGLSVSGPRDTTDSHDTSGD